MEYNGFLYDTSQGIELINSTLLEKPKKGPKQFARRPFIGVLKVRENSLLVLLVQSTTINIPQKCNISDSSVTRTFLPMFLSGLTILVNTSVILVIQYNGPHQRAT